MILQGCNTFYSFTRNLAIATFRISYSRASERREDNGTIILKSACRFVPADSHSETHGKCELSTANSNAWRSWSIHEVERQHSQSNHLFKHSQTRRVLIPSGVNSRSSLFFFQNWRSPWLIALKTGFRHCVTHMDVVDRWGQRRLPDSWRVELMQTYIHIKCTLLVRKWPLIFYHL